MSDSARLLRLIDRLSKIRVLVLGDVMLDHFVYGEILRISPEAPVPVLKTGRGKFVLGGAGNVVRNLQALACGVSFISVVGDDPEGQTVHDILESCDGVDFQLLIEEKRPTTTKTRFIAERQQVLRVDRETTDPIDRSSIQSALRFIESQFACCDVVVLSDYGKGFLCQEVLEEIIQFARRPNCLILVDPRGSDFSRYRGVSIMTPNIKELGAATQLPVGGNEEIVSAAARLIDLCGLQALVATRGPDGLTVVESSGAVRHFKAQAREVFDVSGAGDTVMAVLAASLGSGVSVYDAAELANLAAGLVVGKLGTAVVSVVDLLHAIRHQDSSAAEAKDHD